MASTTKLTVRSATGNEYCLVVYVGADRRYRAFPASGENTKEAVYVAASLMGIREQIDVDGDKVISGEPIQN